VTPPSPSVTLVYNPNAGSGPFARPPRLPVALSPLFSPPETAEPAFVAEAREYVRAETGRELAVAAVTTFEEAVAAARGAVAAGAGLVIAAGGDGTTRAVAEALAGSDTALGILPRGTVNVFAREVGVPLAGVLDALEVCLYGETRRLDLGLCDGRPFLLMASAGFDALAVGNVNADVKGVVGAPAYALSALASLASFVPPHLTLTLGDADAPFFDGPAFLAVIANTASYGGDFRVAPDARLDDGLLDVYLFEAPPGPPPLQTAAFLRQVGEVALGAHLQNPHAHYARASRVRLTASPATALQTDGDALGETASVLIEASPRALAVRVPGTIPR
jgi:YegS/Rv2252/BmrU family lipid kinase